MDSRRPYAAAAATALPPSSHSHSDPRASHPPPAPPPPSNHHQQQQHLQQQHHFAQPQSPHPPPPQHSNHHHLQQQQHPHAPPQPPAHHTQHQYGPPPVNNHSASGPSLPPLQSSAYAPPPASSEQPSTLPPFRHPSVPPPQSSHEHQREGPPHQYHAEQQYHSRSGHATPAPVNRSYSQDSGPQRTPVTPTGPPQYPPSQGQDSATQQPLHHMDHGGHPGYPPSNGVQHHGLPHHHPPPHPEQHPQYMPTPMMDQHHPYPPPQPGQPMYGAQPSYGPATGNAYGPKRKQMRATQACEQCRQRKQKCDEGSPCSFCKENHLSCQYRDTPPAKTDKNMEKLLSYMETHSQGLDVLTAKMDSFENRLRRVEQNTQNSQSSAAFNHMDRPEAAAELAPSTVEDIAVRTRKPELDDHRTAPHKLLLLWPSVRPLLEMAQVEHKDGYVMEAEDRGILRLWTRGEGIDEYDGTHPGGSASPARSDESGDPGSASTPRNDGIWGVGFPSTPNSDTRRSEPYGAGGLKANGEVDLDAVTVNILYDSYMKNIHVMHPFLDKSRLRRMFDNFIKRYSTGRPRAAFAVGNEYGERPPKRQRSNGSTANAGTGSDGEVRLQTERSPGNAIIYLVLAMGKICLHKESLPAIVPDSGLKANAAALHQISVSRGLAASSPTSTTMKQSQMSPSQTPTTHPTPPSEPFRLNESRSRRASVDGSSPSAMGSGSRNMDVIPGVAYYAKAAEILGDQGDGNDLVHAQMFLLAALYKGQLARVKESMSWITMAGRAILILLDRYKLYNQNYWELYKTRMDFEMSQKQIKDRRHSLIVIASWTCLQLESDILAELRLPASGIQGVEHLLLMPNRINEDETYAGIDAERQDDVVFLYYSAQMFIRKKLNQMHREMYGKESLDKPLSEVQEMLSGHELILSAWRRGLPDLLRWSDEDYPPSDILDARLRAKYWGAKYVSNRPFLDYALHILPRLRDGETVESAALDAVGNPRDKADIHLFKAIEQLGVEEVLAASRRCIEAAMHSTVAFDGVPDRLIVTNIHGTAHAQFGNVLVLCAVYRSYMKEFVEAGRLEKLLDRTIKFLRRLAPISPTSAADCGILEKFRQTLFSVGDDVKEMYDDEGVEPMSTDPRSTSNSFSTGS